MMFIKRLSGLATIAVLTLIILGPNAGAEVMFDNTESPFRATSVVGLEVNGNTYDVTFDVTIEAFHVFGPYPGVLNFITAEDAEAAVNALNAALNGAGALSIGSLEGPIDGQVYVIPFETYENSVQWIKIRIGSIEVGTDWILVVPDEDIFYNLDARTWAVFLSSVPTEQSTWGDVKSIYR
jgi:hypothetical protein